MINRRAVVASKDTSIEEAHQTRLTLARSTLSPTVVNVVALDVLETGKEAPASGGVPMLVLGLANPKVSTEVVLNAIGLGGHDDWGIDI